MIERVSYKKLQLLEESVNELLGDLVWGGGGGSE